MQISSVFAIIFADCHGLSCVHVRASSYTALFRVSLRGVGHKCVGLAQKISARCNTGFYVYILCLRHIYSLENYFTQGRCHLAWCVLTLADENYRGEPHEILVKCFINFVYPWFARNKRQIPNDISKYFIHWSIYDLFYNISFFPVNCQSFVV